MKNFRRGRPAVVLITAALGLVVLSSVFLALKDPILCYHYLKRYANQEDDHPKK
jgi:hypothetical protein